MREHVLARRSSPRRGRCCDVAQNTPAVSCSAFVALTAGHAPAEMRDAAQKQWEGDLPVAAASMFARLFATQLDTDAEQCVKQAGEWVAEARWAKCLLGDRAHRDSGLSSWMAAARSFEAK